MPNPETLAWLRKRGWRERAKGWYHKNYPAATYKLQDAIELERAKK